MKSQLKASSKATRSKDEAKHEAILKAATRLFLKNGYTNTSMDAIAEAASVTKQTVYSHYTNKDALFTRMVTSLCDKQVPSDSLSNDVNKPVEALLYEIGLVFHDLITSKEVLAATRLVIAESAQHPKLAERYYAAGTQRLITMLAQFLDAQNARGALAIPDTLSAASYFLALLKGRYYLRMILGLKPIPPEKEKRNHIAETARIFLRIYGGKNPMNTKSVL